MIENCASNELDSTEGGFVIPTTALLLIPLMIFAAFAVDIGGWYAEAGETQRAADAAALASVIYMPDVATATSAAHAEAARNGYVDQPGCDTTVAACVNPAAYPQVILTPVSGQSVQVTIITEGELYFGGVVMDDAIEIERFAVSEYVLPVEMGNPTSALGTGNVGGGGLPSPENMWLAVNGYCTGRQQGDAISAFYIYGSYFCPGFYRTMRPGGWFWQGTQGARTLNTPQYDVNGYNVVITMPPGSETDTWNVEFYDPGVCDLANEFTNSRLHATNNKFGVTLQTTLFKADNTLLDDSDNTTPHGAGEIDWPLTACDWQTGYTIAPTDPRGRWILNYRSRAVTDELGLNYFGVRVSPASSPGSVCVDPLGTSTCPRVAAKDYLPIYVPGLDKTGNPMAPAGTPATFYLAQIDEIHEGKTLELTLFDPGEGMNNLQIVDPFGNRPNFTWETIDDQAYGYNTYADGSAMPEINGVQEDCGGVNCLYATLNRFQNRTVQITIDLNGTPTICDADCWWTIQYTPQGTGSVTDRTTWSIRLNGDPVRLTE